MVGSEVPLLTKVTLGDLLTLVVGTASVLLYLGGLMLTVRQLRSAVDELNRTVHQLDKVVTQTSIELKHLSERLHQLEMRDRGAG